MALEPAAELLELSRALRAQLEQYAVTGVSGLLRGTDPEAAAFVSAWAPESAPAPAPDDAAEPPRAAPAAPAATRAPAQVIRAADVAPRAEPAAAPLDPAARRVALDVLEQSVRGCTQCALHVERTQTVFARGTGSSGLCFVGEGPGADEDAQGYPFVGAAGQLLDKMIVAMGLDRDEVYVCNIVKCRPPNNRKPELPEMEACSGYLKQQLELVSPQVIVALGAVAVGGLLGTTEGITRLRGKWKLYRGRVPVMPTFHPAYLLRTPNAKREVWEDLQAVLRQLGRSAPTRAK